MYAKPDPEKPRHDGEALMMIDGVPVLRGGYTRWLRHFNGENIAPRFVELWVLERAARERGFYVDDEELEERITGEIEPLAGVAENIIIGQPITLGTGAVELIYRPVDLQEGKEGYHGYQKGAKERPDHR